MTIETALYPTQLNATLPPQSDIVREGAGHLRLLKTVVKTTFPNLGGAWNATQTEANYIVGVTSPIQAQINSKGAITGQTWTGAHVFSGTAAVPTLAQGTNTTGAASTAFVQAEWATRLPNYTAPITANSTELNRLVGVTSGVQSQINAKGAIDGQTWTGTHSFPSTTTVGPLTPTIQGYLSTATSDVQAQINSKAAKAGDTYTGAHNFTSAAISVQTLAPGSSGNSAASVDYANALAFASALPSQTGNSGKFITTNGATASWSDTIDGNLNFAGTARRIKGDFSNATLANRLMFQTSVANGNTVVSTLPNGSSTTSGFRAYGSDNLFDGVSADLIASIASGDVRLISNAYGSGAYLPMTFYTGGSERMRIDTSGSVGIGEAPSSQYKFQAANGNWCIHSDVGQLFIESAGRVNRCWIAANISDTVNDGVYIGRGGNGIDTGTKVLKILNDTTHINPNGGLGYGVGAGGTVTQATSKSTAVTLNRPTGQITMNNAALGGGAFVAFNCNNSLLSAADGVLLSASTNGNYRVEVAAVSSGVVQIRVTNITAGSLSEALVIHFAIIKGATS